MEIHISATERILRFIDNGIIQTLAGLVGGLVGTFLDGRYFAALSIAVSFALYRSKALNGVRHRLILPIHLISVTFAACGLYYMGTQLNKSRPHTYTPADYANAVKDKIPFPITQQITNVYNSFISPIKSLGEPRIDLSEFLFDGADAYGMHFHTNAINNGTVPAFDVGGTTKSFVKERSRKSEDEIFDFLESRADDTDQPRDDQPPGVAYSKIGPTIIPIPSQQERLEIQLGLKVIYIGRIDSYSDAKGHRYHSELCMFMTSRSPTLIYCDGHNKTRRLGGDS